MEDIIYHTHRAQHSTIVSRDPNATYRFARPVVDVYATVYDADNQVAHYTARLYDADPHPADSPEVFEAIAKTKADAIRMVEARCAEVVAAEQEGP